MIGSKAGPRDQSTVGFLLIEVRRHGLTVAPELAIGDGALGFWKAVDEVYPARGISATACTRLPTCQPP